MCMCMSVCVYVCVCVRVLEGGGVLSDLNTLDIVVSPGRNSWSAGEMGGGGDKEGGRDGRQCGTLIMGLG